MREIRTSGLMSGERKRSDAHRAQATAPLLDSTALKGPGNTEPGKVVPNLSPAPAAVGGAHNPWIIDPGTAADHTAVTIAAHPGTAIGGSFCIVITPAIFDPFKNVPMNIVKTKVVRGIATNRFRFGTISNSIRPVIIPPVVASRRSRSRHIFPLRLTQQPIAMSCFLRKPRYIMFRIIPIHIDDRATIPAPTSILRSITTATAIGNTGIPFRKRYLEPTDSKRCRNSHAMSRSFPIKPSFFAFR